MKTPLTAAGAVALACALSACSTQTTGQLLTNLQGCARHYDGAVSAGMTGGQFSGTIKVDCTPAEIAAAASASAPVKP